MNPEAPLFSMFPFYAVLSAKQMSAAQQHLSSLKYSRIPRYRAHCLLSQTIRSAMARQKQMSAAQPAFLIFHSTTLYPIQFILPFFIFALYYREKNIAKYNHTKARYWNHQKFILLIFTPLPLVTDFQQVKADQKSRYRKTGYGRQICCY